MERMQEDRGVEPGRLHPIPEKRRVSFYGVGPSGLPAEFLHPLPDRANGVGHWGNGRLLSDPMPGKRTKVLKRVVVVRFVKFLKMFEVAFLGKLPEDHVM